MECACKLMKGLGINIAVHKAQDIIEKRNDSFSFSVNAPRLPLFRLIFHVFRIIIISHGMRITSAIGMRLLGCESCQLLPGVL